jgi:hypothetical protein
LKNAVYRKHPDADYVWFTAVIEGRFADRRSLTTLPPGYEVDRGYTDRCVIRTKKRKKWHAWGDREEAKKAALRRLHSLHQKVRVDVAFISAPVDLPGRERTLSERLLWDHSAISPAPSTVEALSASHSRLQRVAHGGAIAAALGSRNEPASGRQRVRIHPVAGLAILPLAIALTSLALRCRIHSWGVAFIIEHARTVWARD